MERKYYGETQAKIVASSAGTDSGATVAGTTGLGGGDTSGVPKVRQGRTNSVEGEQAVGVADGPTVPRKTLIENAHPNRAKNLFPTQELCRTPRLS